jgi:chromosome segregation ATPase
METSPKKEYVTEVERLQGECDDYTKWLEHERKRCLILEDQYKNEMMKLDEIKAKIKENITDEKAEHDAEVKRLALHHKLRNKKVRLNYVIGENLELKTNIDIMRKEIIFAKDAIKAMTETIEQLKTDATACNKESVVQGKIANETNN